MVGDAREALLVERLQSPELSDVEDELQRKLGDRYSGTGRVLYVPSVEGRGEKVSIYLKCVCCGL